jgi:hypothetical protein
MALGHRRTHSNGGPGITVYPVVYAAALAGCAQVLLYRRGDPVRVVWSRSVGQATARLRRVMPSSMRSGVDVAKHNRRASWKLSFTENAEPGM